MSEITTKTNTQKSKNLKLLFNSIAILMLAGVVIWGIVSFFHIGDNNYTEDAQVDEYVDPINTKVSGYLKEIKFEEHQKVKKGDTLVVIEDDEYKIQLKQALASLKQAEAGKTVINSDVNYAQNSSNISQANIEEERSRLENQKRNLNRYANLLKADVIPQYEYDQVKAEYDAMKAHYEALVQQKNSTILNTKSVSSKVEVSDADILRAQAAVDLAKLNLSYCYILAPYDGIMGRRKIDEEQLVQAGQNLSSIIKNGEKWITANYTESQIGSIKVGDKMDIKIDALKKQTFLGEVVSISGATGSRYSSTPIDNSTGNFVKVQQRIPVRIKFLDNNNQLEQVRAGMNAQVNKK